MPAADDPRVQTTQIATLLDALWPTILVFSVVCFLGFVYLGDLYILLVGLVVFSYGIFTRVARAFLRRGKVRAAVNTVSGTILFMTIVVAFIEPNVAFTLMLTPVMAVAIALPYVSIRAMGALTVGAWVTFGVVVVVASVLGGAGGSGQNPLFWSYFSLASSLAAAAFALLVLWQFRVRLMGTLAQARRAQERLGHEATHDALTGLPNRSLLTERLEGAMGRAKRGAARSFALLFLDLDRFKQVNDSLGHTAGDELLKVVAGRLSCCVRECDTVARMGGDEFVILLEDASAGDAERLVRRVGEVFEAPISLGGRELYVGSSIGVVARPAGYDTPDDLLRDADTAMYGAKEAGKGGHAVFEAGMRRKAVSTLDLETDLRHAVKRGEFVVHYQPIVWLASGGVVGFEALVRWEHPRRGLLYPKAFMALAEETGLVHDVDRFVLGEACRQTALWRSSYPEHFPPQISVNLSPSGLSRRGLSEEVARVLRESSLPAYALVVELTEVAVMEDSGVAHGTLASLRKLGVRVQIDDFGTGYSSLSLLHRLPVDALKVDRSFVGDLGEGAARENEQIVGTIVALGHGLGMDVVAEGVETQGQLETLRRMGCDYVQGHRFSRAVEALSAEAILAAEPVW